MGGGKRTGPSPVILGDGVPSESESLPGDRNMDSPRETEGELMMGDDD